MRGQEYLELSAATDEHTIAPGTSASLPVSSHIPVLPAQKAPVPAYFLPRIIAPAPTPAPPTPALAPVHAPTSPAISHAPPPSAVPSTPPPCPSPVPHAVTAPVPAPIAPTLFPCSFFLNPDFFQSLSYDTFCPQTLNLPITVIQQLPQELNFPSATCSRYLATTHDWFPILSRKVLCECFNGSYFSPLDPTTTTLLCAMKLASTPLPNDPSCNAAKPYVTPLYTTTVSLINALEASDGGGLSLAFVQSLALLCIYELGHAVYPQAWMTVGRAGRALGVMGLAKEGDMRLFAPAKTLTLREEERRVWWGVWVLER